MQSDSLLHVSWILKDLFKAVAKPEWLQLDCAQFYSLVCAYTKLSAVRTGMKMSTLGVITDFCEKK